MDHFRVALTQADGAASEAILEKLPEIDLAAGSLVLLGDESCIGKRLAFGDSFVEIRDLSEFDFSDCAVVLMPEYDASVEERLRYHDAVLVSHCIETDDAAVFAATRDSEINISYSQSRVRLPAAALACLPGVLQPLQRLSTIARVNLVFLQSAEARGKAAIDELASQTISLLNGREAVTSVYPLQIAFNMIPAAGIKHLGRDLSQLLGNSELVCIHQVIDVAAFHGLAISVQLEFVDDIEIGEVKRVLSEIEQVSIIEGDSSPISDCNQSFSCVINRLQQDQNQSDKVHFWMIADPMRFGLANNYVNITDILLKSFL